MTSPELKMNAMVHAIQIAQGLSDVLDESLTQLWSPLERLYVALKQPHMIPKLGQFTYPNWCLGLRSFSGSDELLDPMDLQMAQNWSHVTMRDFQDHPNQNMTGEGIHIFQFPQTDYCSRVTPFIAIKQFMANAVLNSCENICWLPDIDVPSRLVPDIRPPHERNGGPGYWWGVSVPVVIDVWSHHDQWNDSYYDHNLLMGVCTTSDSTFRMVCGDDVYDITEPVIIKFNSALNHSITRISGTGVMVCVLWSKQKISY